jgi:hypothetical protein
LGGVHFCARLSAFKVLSLFFCNSIDPWSGFDRAPEISKSAEIFGKDCEVHVTLAYSIKIITFQSVARIYRKSTLFVFCKLL